MYICSFHVKPEPEPVSSDDLNSFENIKTLVSVSKHSTSILRSCNSFLFFF